MSVGDSPSSSGDSQGDSGPGSSDALLRDIAHAPERPLFDDDARIGTRLGRFQILERLGRGGMGVVYAARDEKLSRVVALKLLLARGALDAEHRRRLTREARAASAISHSGIATVYDVGEIDGHVFIAMERVVGRTLRAHLSGGPLPIADAVRIGAALARALGAAHEVGIVHRDLKPDNVMIADDGSVKVLDFGLAKPLEKAREGDATESSELTQEGRILGTPSYMSPEQASGLSVDERSDVFSLGVVLYEMLSGKRPFLGETRMQTLVSVTRDRPRPVGKRRSGIPLALSRLVQRCLEKEPQDRPRSANAIAAELERVAAGGATRRLPWIAAGLGLAVVAAIAAVRAHSTTSPPLASTTSASAPPETAAPDVPIEPASTEAVPSMQASAPPSAPSAETRILPRPSAPRGGRPPSPSALPASTGSARPPRDPLAVQK